MLMNRALKAENERFPDSLRVFFHGFSHYRLKRFLLFFMGSFKIEVTAAISLNVAVQTQITFYAF